MITQFPDPYTDEILYSVYARYTDLMRFPNYRTSLKHLFGDYQVSVLVDLPNRIRRLNESLPPGHLYSIVEFIDKNTLFRFYAPFLSSERCALVTEEMAGDGPNNLRSQLNISARSIPRPAWLRFCPECAKSDRQEHGETYWHRAHQLSGVQVCPQHDVFLEDSNLPWSKERRQRKPITAENGIINVKPHRLDLNNNIDVMRLQLARDAQWLLNWRGLPLDDDILRRRYHNLLLRRGLADNRGQIKRIELRKEFIDYYTAGFLAELNCGISHRNGNWLNRLLNESTSRILQPPMRHLLIINFLGLTAEEFFTSFQEYKPFGDGPWPCFNHAASHFQHLVVTDCQVYNGTKKNLGKPVGTFTCDCGLIYTAIGPLDSNNTRIEPTSVLSYGKVWEAKLRELWADETMAIYQIAQLLGVGITTLKRRAISLKLKYPREVFGSTLSSGEIPERYIIRKKTHEEELAKRRAEWLKLRDEHPEATRLELQSKVPSLLFWLRRKDPIWLEENMPAAKGFSPPPVTVNWLEEDNKLCLAIIEATDRLRKAEPLVRVSLSAIIREVGRRSWLEQFLHKLPLTKGILNACTESREQFLVRKVKWAEQKYREEGVKPTGFMLRERAGIRGRAFAGSPAVVAAVDEAIAALFTHS